MLTTSGRTMQRVRLIREPPSDYQKFELAVTPTNLEAGEDIRVLTRPAAAGLDLPDYDFWLFDDTRLAIMHFAGDDTFLGAELLEDEAAVADHRRARDRAVARAIPYTRYIAIHPVDSA